MLGNNKTGCAITQKIKVLCKTTVVSNFGCRRFRSATKSIGDMDDKAEFNFTIFYNFCKRKFKSAYHDKYSINQSEK